MSRNKLRPPKWTAREEYEQAYRETQQSLRWIGILGSVLAIFTHVINTFVFWPVPHPYYWLFWAIGSVGLVLAVAALLSSCAIKHQYPTIVNWYEKNQGDDAVTITDSE